ncbi:MAG: hypothetical protein U9N35_02640 [Euryarchaeota archaeon]|nr:hypothetical protein [Euryarchaeota archaeon]
MEDLKKYMEDVLEEEELIEIKGEAFGKLASESKPRDKSWVYEKYFTLEPEKKEEEKPPEEEEDPLKLFEDIPEPMKVTPPEVKAPKREFPLPERPRPPKHEEEISPKTKEVLRDAEEANDLYDLTYITHNLDTVRSKYLQLLNERNKLPDKNPYVIERVDKNLGELKKRIAEIEKKKESREKRGEYQDFIRKIDRVLRECTKKYIAAHSEEVRRNYLQLLDEKNNLSSELPQQKEVAEKRVRELRDRIDAVERGKDLKKEVISIMKLSNVILKKVENGKTEGILSNYRNCVDRYESISKDIPKPVADKVKRKLSSCKQVIESLKRTKKRRRRTEKKQKARTSKYEVQGLKIYWKTYLKEIEDFDGSLSRAKPAQYFELYDKFNKLRDTYSNLVKRNVIPQAELQKARIELSNSFGVLEDLKQEI